MNLIKKNIKEMNTNVYYQKDELPIDFYGSEDSHNTVYESEKDKTVDKSKKNSRFLPTQLMLLLPPIAAQVLYYLYGFSLNSDGKNYFYQRTFNSLKMTEDEFYTALQTLIDNGIVNVTRRDETTYDYIVNYDKINEFNFPFKEMVNMEKIKLSTEVTFRNINDYSCSIDELTDEQMKEITIDQFIKFKERFYSLQKKKEMVEEDSLFGEKERQRKVRDEMARECFLLSKKDSRNVSE